MTRETEDRVARYLDETDEPAERKAFEAAAADDPELRRRLIDGFRSRAAADIPAVPAEVLARAHALGEAEARRPAFRSPRGWVLAASIAVLVLGTALLLRLDRSTISAPDALRDSPSATNATVVTLLEPAADAMPAADPIRFRWHSVSDATGYTVVIMDAEGTVLVRASTDQPSLALDVPTSGTTPFYWFVEARRPAGPTIASEVRRWAPAPEREPR